MTINQSDYVNVVDRLQKLGLGSPSRMAFLPVYFESAESVDDCKQLADAATIKKVLQAANFPLDDVFEKNQRPPLVQNNSSEFVLPVIFFTYSAYNGDIGLLYETAKSILSYIKKAHPDPLNENTVKMSYVIESNNEGICKKFEYSGPVDGITQLPDFVKSFHNE